MRRAVPLLVLALAGTALSACGDTGEESRSAPAASVTAKSNPDQTVAATQTDATTATSPATPTTSTKDGGETEPNAGDESGIRVPAAYTLTGGAFKPATIAVPAYLRVELIVANRDARAATVTFRNVTLEVPSGATRSSFVDGLKPGRYRVTGPGGATATLVSGAKPGP